MHPVTVSYPIRQHKSGPVLPPACVSCVNLIPVVASRVLLVRVTCWLCQHHCHRRTHLIKARLYTNQRSEAKLVLWVGRTKASREQTRLSRCFSHSVNGCRYQHVGRMIVCHMKDGKSPAGVCFVGTKANIWRFVSQAWQSLPTMP